MNFDLEKIIEGKRALRRNLAARPIAEKLRLLEAMRERELAIRGRTGRTASAEALREAPLPYKTETTE